MDGQNIPAETLTLQCRTMDVDPVAMKNIRATVDHGVTAVAWNSGIFICGDDIDACFPPASGASNEQAPHPR
ncbi:hypothetical protein N7492_004828 [Penicillium capsulatum]|uniref:Uncharacterized protein n=1 Tax=Penicillium capsulatum TaxID=69766 RepID=A0A9W9IB64_9EURO|nr:hypothetical protein N7492_004828 [Penicillium capsulatum]KAJ6136063.1 hypothetical protein N7512_001223 [Penicillium capsulatum]